MDAIFEAKVRPPPMIIDILHYVRESVVKVFPTPDSVRYIAVSGFIFLRFFAPAVLGPKLFHLYDGECRDNHFYCSIYSEID